MPLSKAIAAHEAGNLSEAERLYRSALENDPLNADACGLLGVVMGARGAYDEAIVWVDKSVALDPASGLLHFHRGTVLMAAQKLPQAVEALKKAAALMPDVPQFHFNYANALRASDDWRGAIAQYDEALKLNPKYLEALNNLALSLIHEKQYKEAFQTVSRAVAIDENYGDGWLTFSNVAEKIKDYETALQAGIRACDLLPDNHFAWFGYGVALNRLNRDAEAADAYQKALELNPSRADIWDNLAQSYQSMNRLQDAERAFRKAVEVDGQTIADENREIDEKEYGHRHWHLALIELIQGKYKKGFARYRARTAAIPELKRQAIPFPLWKGENLCGKSLLVCDEQGFGDTIMMARFLPVLRRGGARIVFSVHPVLKSVFEGWDGVDSVIAHGEKVQTCDYFCSSFDLPHRCGATLEDLPQNVPYVPCFEADEATRLSEKGFKVGVVWGGSPLHLSDKKRSIPLALFADLFTVPNVTFYCLNRDLKAGDAETLHRYPMKNLIPLLTDFAASAKLIGQMDLLITCDTATAHLAGALGKKTWILLPFAPDWRWLTGRDDSPWYPSARLFRQPKPEDWQSVLLEVKKALLSLAA